MHGAHDILHGTPRSNLKLLGAGAYEAPQGKDFPPHRHSSWELVYYRAGHIRCPVGDEVFDVRPGMLLLTPPGVVHAEEARTAYANYYLGVEVSGGMDGPRACFDDADRSVGGLCHALVREWQGTGTDRDEMIGLLLRQLELVLRRVRSERLVCPAERIVAEIEHLLEQRYTAPVRIADLAREVGV